MNTKLSLTGILNVRVEGQKALSTFQQEMNKRFIAMGGEMPESLRYQCRIASDANAAFERVDLPDGEVLTLHPKAKSQFGKNRDGLAFLTVTVTYSGDGKAYRLRWIGQNVPKKMQSIAVKHDEGKYVASTTVPLDLGAAEVTVSKNGHGRGRTPAHARAYEDRFEKMYGAPRHVVRAEKKRTERHCGRLTAADLPA